MIFLDASAVLAVLQQEAGGEAVQLALLEQACAISTVNVAEVLGRLVDKGIDPAAADAAVSDLQFQTVDFTRSDAALSAQLRAATRTAGLSLADRACIATAARHDALVVTADRNWAKVELPVDIQLVR